MLIGKMKIELTDIYTGKKEVVKEENMATNALSEIFSPLGHLMNGEHIYNSYNMYYEKLLGGLLLFDGTIEEDVNQLYAPSNVNLVGSAVYGMQNNTTGKMRGGFNHTESEFNSKQKYMKFVYDFSTSQANGTISSVCLTHQAGGYTGYGSSDAVVTTESALSITPYSDALQYARPSHTGADTGDKYSGITVGTTEVLFLLDPDQDTCYYFKIKDSTSISIIKRRMYLKSISLFENPYIQKAKIEEFDLDTLGIALEGRYIAYNYDAKENSLYIFTSDSSTTGINRTYLITRIKLSDWSLSQWEMANTADKTLNTGDSRFAFASNGYVYLRSYDSPHELYKFEIGNAANVIKINRSGVESIDGLPMFAINGRIYYQKNNRYSLDNRVYIVNEETNECLKPENYSICGPGDYMPCMTPLLNHPMKYYCSYGGWHQGSFFIFCNYLATINNLSEPVVKSADKTMKITYIIQEE